MSRFVRPDVTRLSLSNGDWIEVKRRLTAGDQRSRFARMSLAGVDGSLRVNHLEVGLATITAYLIDWSFKDANDKKVEIRDLSADQRGQVLDALDPNDFKEVLDAIEAHEAAMDAERDVEKKAPDGGTKSPAISPSPDTTAGPTST